MTQPSAKAFALGANFLQKLDKSQETHIAWQMDHRLELVDFWDIKPGSRVLELGCGQGDCTVVLADAVGENGHVDAVDPGSPDYGSPFTLSQAQAHIKTTPLGPRIIFHLSTDPLDFLGAMRPDSKPYDYIVLSHCIWYFESPSILSSILAHAKSRTSKLLLAEWSLRCSSPQAYPHVLAALLHSSLEAKRLVPSSGNIRTILSPAQIISTVHSSKNTSQSFKLERQLIKETNEGMLDGFWETSSALRTRDRKVARMREEGVSEKETVGLEATWDALESSVTILGEDGLKTVRSMDFWVGVFTAV